MKKLILVSTVFLVVGCSDGAVTTPTTNSLRSPDIHYELDTWGENSEVYEFTPVTAPTKTCIVFILDNLKSMAMQCFDKVNEQ